MPSTNNTPVSSNSATSTAPYGAAQATLDIRAAGVPAWMVVVMCRKAYAESGYVNGDKYRASIEQQIAAYHELKAITDAKNAAKLADIMARQAVVA